MEDLIIEVTHSKELIFKITKYRFKKQQRKYLSFTIFSGALAVALFLSNVLFNYSPYRMIIGYLFMIACGLFAGSTVRLSSKAIVKFVDKNIESFPINSKYVFSDNKFIVETKYQTATSKSEYEYASIALIHRIDQKTLYILLKTNIYCAIVSDKCDEVVALINSKISQ